MGCFAKIMMTRYHCIKLILWVYLTTSPVIKLILTDEGKVWVYLDNQRIVVTIFKEYLNFSSSLRCNYIMGIQAQNL